MPASSVTDQGPLAIHNVKLGLASAFPSVTDQGPLAIHNHRGLALHRARSVTDQGPLAIHNGESNLPDCHWSVTDQGPLAIYNESPRKAPEEMRLGRTPEPQVCHLCPPPPHFINETFPVPTNPAAVSSRYR